MTSPLPASGKRQLILRCDSLHLEVAFSLRPGEYARIGSSAEMEITLPLNGLSEEECQISCDDAGFLWLALPGGARVRSPDGFQAGPYFFSLSETAPAAAPTAAPAPAPLPSRIPHAAAPAAAPNAFSMLSPAEASLLEKAAALTPPPLPPGASSPSSPPALAAASTGPPSPRQPARHRTVLTAGAAAVLLTSAGLWFYFRGNPDNKTAAASSSLQSSSGEIAPASPPPPEASGDATAPPSTPAPGPDTTPAATSAAASSFTATPDVPLPVSAGAKEDALVSARETLATIVWVNRMEATLATAPNDYPGLKRRFVTAAGGWITSDFIDPIRTLESTLRASAATERGGLYDYLTTPDFKKAIEPFPITSEAQAREYLTVMEDAAKGRLANPVLRSTLLARRTRSPEVPEPERAPGTGTREKESAADGGGVAMPRTYQALVFVRKSAATLAAIARKYDNTLGADVEAVSGDFQRSIYRKAADDLETRLRSAATAATGAEGLINTPLYKDAIRPDDFQSAAEARDFLGLTRKFLSAESDHDTIRGVLLANYTPYQKDPAWEFEEDYVHTIRNRAFPGLIIDADYPLSWYPRDSRTGAPPTNGFGTGDIACALSATAGADIASPVYLRRTLEKEQTAGTISALKEFTAGRLTTFRFSRENDVPAAAGSGTGTRNFARRIYMVIGPGYSIQFAFQTYGTATASVARERLDKHLPLFDLIVSSVQVNAPAQDGKKDPAPASSLPGTAEFAGPRGTSQIRSDAEAGDARAQFELAQLYEYGEGVLRDTVEASRWLRKSAQGGDAAAQYYLARECFAPLHGDRKPDPAEGFAWLTKAAGQDYVPALVDLSGMHRIGVAGVVKKDPARAFKLCERAAKLEDADALEMLAHFYYEGTGVKPDYRLAMETARRAAAGGCMAAHQLIGLLYEMGKGVPGSYVKAVEHYRLAAAAGDVQSQSALGMILGRGREGVPKDAVEAEEWLSKAAWQGNLEAQGGLAILYFHGGSIPRDVPAASVWCQVAIAGAPPKDEASAFARQMLKKINTELTREAQAKAEKDAQKLIADIAAKIKAGASAPQPFKYPREED